EGERSGIWKNVCESVGVLRRRLVFLEKVAAIRGRGLSVVSENLAEVGYDLLWTTLRASDAGFAHHRNRWFGLAVPSDAQGGSEHEELEGGIRRSSECRGSPSSHSNGA